MGFLDDLFGEGTEQSKTQIFSHPAIGAAIQAASKNRDYPTLSILGKALGDKLLMAAGDFGNHGYTATVDPADYPAAKPGLVDMLRKAAQRKIVNQKIRQAQQDFKDAGFDATVE